MTSSSSRVALLLVLSSTLAFTQTTGGGTTGSTGAGSTSGGGTRGVGTTSTAPTSRGRSIPPVREQEQSRPITLSGRVVLDDGNPPSERVSIERVCNGKARREAYTDSRGYFTFTIDDRQPLLMMQDASVGAEALDSVMRPTGAGPSMMSADPMSSRNLTGCELRAVMAGTTSDTIQLTGRRPFDDPNVGTIVLRRLAKVAGSTVSVTSLQAPSNARKEYERGRKAVEKNKLDDAKANLTKAVEIYPAYAEAWAELSDLHLKARDFQGARDASEKAIAADARFLRPYFTLIILAAGNEDWKRTAELSDKLVSLDSYNYPAGYYYNALANYKLHNIEKADASVRAARKLDPNKKLPKIGLLMATIMMDRNDFAGAVQEFRLFLDQAQADNADAQYARSALTMAQNKLASAGAQKP